MDDCSVSHGELYADFLSSVVDSPVSTRKLVLVMENTLLDSEAQSELDSIRRDVFSNVDDSIQFDIEFLVRQHLCERSL